MQYAASLPAFARDVAGQNSTQFHDMLGTKPQLQTQVKKVGFPPRKLPGLSLLEHFLASKKSSPASSTAKRVILVKILRVNCYC